MSANLLSMGAVDFGIIVDGGVVIIESILRRSSRARPGRRDHRCRADPDERIAARDAGGGRARRCSRCSSSSPRTCRSSCSQRVEGRIFAPMANTVVARAGRRAALLGDAGPGARVVRAIGSRRAHRESPVLALGERARTSRRCAWALGRPCADAAASRARCWRHASRSCRTLGSEFLPELNEGALYVTFTLPVEHLAHRGAQARAAADEHLPAPQPQRRRGAVAARAPRGRHRPDAHQQPRVLREAQAAGRVAAGDARRSATSIAAMTQRRRRDPRHRGELLAADPRQREREHHRAVRADRGQALRRRPGRCCSSRPSRRRTRSPKVPGVADLGIVKSGEMPQIAGQARSRRARRATASTLDDFQHAFETALGGHAVGEFWEGERRFDVVMRLPLSAREDVEELARSCASPSTGGVAVPLDALAEVERRLRPRLDQPRERPALHRHPHERARPRPGSFVDEARARGRDAGAECRRASRSSGAASSRTRSARWRACCSWCRSRCVITFVLLFKAFGSFSLAVLIAAQRAVRAVGGVVGLCVAGMPLSVAAAVGFIALIGQASLNGVLVLSAIAERAPARRARCDEAIVGGCRERLRAVLMTASLAALGLVPAALSRAHRRRRRSGRSRWSSSAARCRRCVLTLVLLPVMYQLLARATSARAPLCARIACAWRRRSAASLAGARRRLRPNARLGYRPAMEFGLFYEIPVPRPWTARSERDALHAVVAQAVRGEEVGFTHFWTVEHHFLDEFSHCSAPEVLYGAIAARTSRIKIGHGVRLLPCPYNHPLRVAEMAGDARLPVRRPPRVRHRPLVDARRAGGLRHRPGRHARHVGGGARRGGRRVDERRLRVAGQLLQGAAAARAPEAAPEAASAAVGRVDQPRQPRARRARKGLGLLSFTIGVPPEELAARIQLYRDGLAEAKPVGQVRQLARRHLHHGALRGDQRARRGATRPSRCVWYLRKSIELIGTLATWQAERQRELGTLRLRADAARPRHLAPRRFDVLDEMGAVHRRRPGTLHRARAALPRRRLRSAPLPDEPVQASRPTR